jgi:DNA-binding NarL/FixJ family response regulator
LGKHKPRVVLADDQAAILAVLAKLLQTEFDVVATVRDGPALVDAVARVSPDAIVTDISMPFLDGIEAAREILCRNPSARVVFVTVHADALMMQRGLAVGGLGYVAKVSAGEQLVPAVWAALRGERWYPCDS